MASSGGHLTQLMMLSPLMDEFDSFIVTEETESAKSSKRKTYYLKQINRKEIAFLPLMCVNAIRSIHIYIKEKPDVIVSTGVLATIPMCMIAKLFRKKVIYIESFAKIHSPTLTGRLMYKITKDFFVQWPSMKDVYPNAIYKGALY